jgi:hypothetical protein
MDNAKQGLCAYKGKRVPMKAKTWIPAYGLRE